MLTTLMLATLAAAPEIETSKPAEDHQHWALNLGIASPQLAVVNVGLATGLSGIGGLPSVGLLGNAAQANLSLERALTQHLTLTLGLGASVSRPLPANAGGFYSFSVLPGVRWYSTKVFEGFWVGGNVGARASWADAPTFEWKAVDVDLLAGWTMRFGPNLLVGLNGGPTATVSFSALSGASSAALSFGLKAALTAGVAF